MASQSQFNTTATSGSDARWIVAASQTAVLILSSSQDQRVHASIFNDSAASLFIKFGSDVSLGNSGSAQIYDLKITSASYFELPKPIYQGDIWGLWDATGGWARVLQLGRDDK